MFVSKMKQTKPLSRKAIEKKLNFWKKHLDLNPKWDISFVLHKTSLDMPEGVQDMEAWIDIRPSYWDAEIYLNGPLLDENNIDNVLVHELLHILTEPLDTFTRSAAPEKYHEFITTLNESMIENLIPAIMAGSKHR